jgi:fatty acid desaturase
MALGLLPKGHICAWNHHHQHVPTFRQPVLNRLLEVVYALQTGITSGTWELHHSIGHHMNYLDQSKDESRWQTADGKVMSELWYTLEVGATAYPRAFVVGLKRPAQLKRFLWMGALTLVVLTALIVLKPVASLVLFATPMVFGLFFTAWATYSHHSGLSTDSHFEASRNILHRGYNLLTGNLGYHTAHHYKPGLHWSELPALHAKIADQIPESCYLTPGFPWTLGQTPEGEKPTDTVKPASEPVAEPVAGAQSAA